MSGWQSSLFSRGLFSHIYSIDLTNLQIYIHSPYSIKILSSVPMSSLSTIVANIVMRRTVRMLSFGRSGLDCEFVAIYSFAIHFWNGVSCMMIIFKVHKGVISLHFYGLHFANWSKYILVIIRVLTYFDIFCVGMLGNSSHIYFAFLFHKIIIFCRALS